MRLNINLNSFILIERGEWDGKQPHSTDAEVTSNNMTFYANSRYNNIRAHLSLVKTNYLLFVVIMLPFIEENT